MEVIKNLYYFNLLKRHIRGSNISNPPRRTNMSQRKTITKARVVTITLYKWLSPNVAPRQVDFYHVNILNAVPIISENIWLAEKTNLYRVTYSFTINRGQALFILDLEWSIFRNKPHKESGKRNKKHTRESWPIKIKVRLQVLNQFKLT